MSSAPRQVLHEYKTGFLLILIPLFFAIGCLLLTMSVGMPLLLRTSSAPSEPGFQVSIAIAFAAGLGMPVLAVALWLLIPAITTFYDPARQVLALEYRRPIGRSVKEYRLADIADIRPIKISSRTYSLGLILKDGRRVRLEYGSTSNTGARQEKAAKIKTAIGLAGREIVL